LVKTPGTENDDESENLELDLNLRLTDGVDVLDRSDDVVAVDVVLIDGYRIRLNDFKESIQ